MKIDNYTKSVLTIIAIALTLNLFIGAKTTTSQVPLNEDGSMNVRVMTMPETIDVNIDEVGGYSTYGNLPVDIKAGSVDVDEIDGQVHVWVDNN